MFKKIFSTLLSFSGSLAAVGGVAEVSNGDVSDSIKCVSLNNQLCTPRPTLIDVNSNETLYYPFFVSVYTSVVEVVTLLMIHMLE